MNKHKVVTPNPFKGFETGSDALDNVLRLDPVAAAEEEFGIPHSEFTEEMMLSCMRGGVKLSSMKETLLQSSKDTYNNIKFDDAIQLLVSAGFKKGFSESLVHFPGDINPVQYDIYSLYYRVEDGLIIEIESYGSSVNRLNLFGNIIMSPGSHIPACTNGYDNGATRFDIDGREGLFHNIERFKKAGELLPVWVSTPLCTWFVNRNIFKDPDVKFTARVGYEKTIEKYVNCPSEMQNIMTIYYDTFKEER